MKVAKTTAMRLNDWRNVTTKSGYNSYDCFDDNPGDPVTEGVYLILWPDQTQSIHEVKIWKKSSLYGDMGNIYTNDTSVAYVMVDYHGVQAKVHIAGLYIRKEAIQNRSEKED